MLSDLPSICPMYIFNKSYCQLSTVTVLQNEISIIQKKDMYKTIVKSFGVTESPNGRKVKYL